MLALTLHPKFMEVLWNFHNIHTSSTHFFLSNPFSWCFISVYGADCTSIRWFMYPGGDMDWAQSSLYKNIFNVHHTTTANRGHCPVLQLLARPYEMGCESCAFKLISAIFLIFEGNWRLTSIYGQIQAGGNTVVCSFLEYKHLQSSSHLCSHTHTVNLSREYYT